MVRSYLLNQQLLLGHIAYSERMKKLPRYPGAPSFRIATSVGLAQRPIEVHDREEAHLSRPCRGSQ